LPCLPPEVIRFCYLLEWSFSLGRSVFSALAPLELDFFLAFAFFARVTLSHDLSP
jgi:hypothetical protein